MVAPAGGVGKVAEELEVVETERRGALEEGRGGRADCRDRESARVHDCGGRFIVPVCTAERLDQNFWMPHTTHPIFDAP